MMRIEGQSAGDRGRPSRPIVGDRLLSVAVVVAATVFNAVLAAINAHAGHLNEAVVIGAEMLITVAAVILGLNGRVALKQPWLMLTGILVVLGLGTGLASGHIDPKFMRDVLLIPIFVLLGLSCTRTDVIRTVITLQSIVFAVMLLEGISPTTYAKTFDVMGYYINTRGFKDQQFWNSGSDLFISATRPSARFIGGLDLHRLSSVFLEPVSLGNYCVIVAMIAAALWPSLSIVQRAFLLMTEAAILVGCDGRFAALSIALIVGLHFLTPVLPRKTTWLYLPGVLGAAATVVFVRSIPPGGDDFSGRMAGSIATLSQLDGAALMGFMTPMAYRAMDSGITYLLISQSLGGVLVLWTFIALGSPQEDRPATVMTHAVCLYVSLLLLISYSLFSIKTAALLWFSYGAIARPVGEKAPSAQRRRSTPVRMQEQT